MTTSNSKLPFFLTYGQETTIRKLILAGKSANEIAAETGVSQSSVVRLKAELLNAIRTQRSAFNNAINSHHPEIKSA